MSLCFLGNKDKYNRGNSVSSDTVKKMTRYNVFLRFFVGSPAADRRTNGEKPTDLSVNARITTDR
jgi:hypothetical protein